MSKSEYSLRIDQASLILKLLGESTRLTMLKVMEDGACCVCEFVAMFEISQPAISQHLKKLSTIGLVQEEKRGQWVFYSLNKQSEYYPFTASILQQLPSQQEKLDKLKEQGKRVVCC